jgi:hypothetical protein
LTLQRRKKQLAATRRAACALHPDKLLITKYGTEFCYFCDAPPVDRIRSKSETEKYMTGEPQNAAIQSKMRQKYGEMTVTQQTALELKKPTDAAIVATGKLLEQSIDGFGSNLPDSDLILATQLTANGFQPMHMNVIHGHLYLNYKGRVFWTKRALGALDGGATDRPMTPDERIAYQLEDDEVGVVATVYKLNPINGERMPFENIGRAGGSRDKTQTVAKQNKAEMAIKRAYCRAMELACPLGVNMETLIEGYEVMNTDTGDVRDVTETVEAISAPAEDGLTASADELANDTPPTTKVSKELATITVEKIVENGFGKEDLKGFNYLDFSGQDAVMQMLKNGYNADQVANSVKEVLDPPAETGTVVQVSPDGTQENVEELPW